MKQCKKMILIALLISCWQCINEFPEKNLGEQLLIMLLVDQIQYGNDSIVVSSDSGFYYSRINIDTKFILNQTLSGIAIKAIATKGEHMFAATNNGLYRSHDYANNFSLAPDFSGLSTANIVDVAIDLNTGHAGVITASQFYYSTDNGFTFTNTGNISPHITKSLSMQNGNIFICSNSAAPNNIFKSTDNGVNFTSIGAGGPTLCNSIKYFEANGNKNLLASTQTGLYISTDLGSSWAAPITSANGLNDDNVLVMNLDASGKWYVGSGIGIAKGLTSSTAAAFPVFSPVFNNQVIYDILPIGTSVLVCTSNGLFLSNDSGNTFAGPISSTAEFPPSQCNRVNYALSNTRLKSND